MILDVNPTRMELLRLKKRHAIAVRGHKLLKDKPDEFIRIMLAQVKQIGELKKTLDRKLEQANQYMTLASHTTFPEAVIGALMTANHSLEIGITYRQILNINVPEFSVHQQESARPSSCGSRK